MVIMFYFSRVFQSVGYIQVNSNNQFYNFQNEYYIQPFTENWLLQTDSGVLLRAAGDAVSIKESFTEENKHCTFITECEASAQRWTDDLV